MLQITREEAHTDSLQQMPTQMMTPSFPTLPYFGHFFLAS